MSGFFQGDPNWGDKNDPNFTKDWESDAVPMPEVGEEEEHSFLPGLQIPARALRSATDQFRFEGPDMFQGNPAGRSPGVSKWWTPDPGVAGTYTHSDAFIGTPGRGLSPTGSISKAPRPAGLNVSRSVLGQPQFKVVNDVSGVVPFKAAGKVIKSAPGKKFLQKYAGRLVPGLGAGLAAVDIGGRLGKGDLVGAGLGAISAIPGPIGWAGVGTQFGYDVARGSDILGRTGRFIGGLGRRFL